MRRLSAADVVTIWERGQDQDDVGRALTILEFTEPEQTRRDLAALPIGRRDILLLEVHNLTFGAVLDAVVDCPTCGEPLECALDGAEVYHTLAVDPAEQGGESPVTIDGFTVTVRLPNSTDLRAVRHCPSLDAARALLFERCIVSATREEEAIEPRALPDPVVRAVALAVAERDQAATIDLDLTCPACSHGWQAPLDLASFLWTKLAVAVRRLFLEVDALARAYGWRETDILAMSASRRQCYLELIW